MNHPRIALFVVLAACARPAYSGYGTAGEASPAAPALPTTTATRAAPVGPSAGVSGSTGRRPAPPRLSPRSLTTGSATAPVLVIPAQEMDATTYGRIVEDLSVMSRIIEKGIRSLPDDAYGVTTTGSRIYVFLPSDNPGPAILRSAGPRPKALYIGGYGAIFSLQVDFPLVPPPQAPASNKTAEKGDQVWAAAQHELANPPAALPVRPSAAPGRPYRSEAVDALRSTLVSLLQHATNIRDLGPESWLTILVQGPGLVPDQPEESPGNQHANLILGGPTTGTSLLTLRAKKADIDQFAKGQLDQTQFQQRVQIVAR